MSRGSSRSVPPARPPISPTRTGAACSVCSPGPTPPERFRCWPEWWRAPLHGSSTRPRRFAGRGDRRRGDRPLLCPGERGRDRRHFAHVAAHCPVPVIAYNIPVNAGYELPTDVLRDLLTDGVVAGVKDSSPNLTGMRALASSLPDGHGFPLFTGSDALLDAAPLAGANGAVAGLANVAPRAFVTVLRAHAANDAATLAAIQRRMFALTCPYQPAEPDRGVNAARIEAVKTALKLLGAIDSDMLAYPMRGSSEARTLFVKEVLASSGLLAVDG
ncbi:dihydrodipicolinate synthase family protein [Streptomyces sp. NPDC091292]|uniref:dihydrodipicolinate synthase family protein n=1 Tax=Streptomyces sp. NPDC091292 TaxID=3365991 RepID=UPI00380D832E